MPMPVPAATRLQPLPPAFLPAGLAAAGGTSPGLRPVFLLPLMPQGMQPQLPLPAGGKPGQPPAAAMAQQQQQQQMAAYMRLMQAQALHLQAQARAWPAPPLPLPLPLPLPSPSAEAVQQPLVQQVRPGDPIPPPPPLEWLMQSEQAVEAASAAPAGGAAARASAAAEPAPGADESAEQQGEEVGQKQPKARGVRPPEDLLPPLPKPRPKPPPLPPPAPLPVIPNPLPPASEVVCADTLQRLVRLPPRNISLDSEEQEGGAQVLTALELARQARIAANRAYLTGLGLGPQAMNAGLVSRCPPSSPMALGQAWHGCRVEAAVYSSRAVRLLAFALNRRNKSELQPDGPGTQFLDQPG